MADVDKSLPNVRQNITVPSDEEMVDVQTDIQESLPSEDSTEITESHVESGNKHMLKV
jgi:hypothetical protein